MTVRMEQKSHRISLRSKPTMEETGKMVRMQALLEVMEMEAQEEPVEPIKLKVL